MLYHDHRLHRLRQRRVIHLAECAATASFPCRDEIEMSEAKLARCMLRAAWRASRWGNAASNSLIHEQRRKPGARDDDRFLSADLGSPAGIREPSHFL